jgi:hypothetical protein
MTDPPPEPHKFFIRPPENFYEMSEEEQLRWTRQVGEELKAARDAQGSDHTSAPEGNETG